MEDLLSEKENRRITDLVLRLSRTKDEKERKRLMEEAVERTEILIYLIPIERGYLAREDAAAFYLEQKKNAPTIVGCYKVSSLWYHDYLAQVLRKRCITWTLREKKRHDELLRLSYEAGRKEIESCLEEKEKDDSWSAPYHSDRWLEDCEWEMQLKALDMTVKDVEGLYETPRKAISKMDLRETVLFMKKARAPEGLPCISDGEWELRRRLSDQKERNSFIEMLLWLPETDETDLTAHLSRVLGVSEEVLDRFFRLRNESSSTDRERIEKKRELANRHFRLLLRADYSYSRATDEDDRERHLENSEKLRSAYRLRISEMKHGMHGMTQRQIAEIMGVSRSLVSVDIDKARKMLEETLSDLVLQSGESEDKLVSI